MSELALGTFGAIAGLVLAFLANLVLLPGLQRRTDGWVPDAVRTPITGWNNRNVKLYNTFAYRFVLPILLAAFGAIAAVQMFGGVE